MLKYRYKSIMQNTKRFTIKDKKTFARKLTVILAAFVMALAPIGSTLFQREIANAAPGDYSFAGTLGVQEERSYPYGIAVASDGTLFVSDQGNATIVHMTSDGEILNVLNDFGLTSNERIAVSSLAFDDSDYLYAVDTGGHRVLKITMDGDFVEQFGSGTSGVGTGQLQYPGDVTVDPSGNVYISCGSSSVNYMEGIKKFDSAGNEIASWIYTTSSADGRFNWISGIVFSNDEIFVSDTRNNRVQVISAVDGSFLRKWGTQGSNVGEFSSLSGIAVDLSGNILVAEAGNHRIQVFTPTGSYVETFGNASGQNSLQDPRHIAIDSTGNKYVTDSFTMVVYKYDSTNNYVMSFPIQSIIPDELFDAYFIGRDDAGNIYAFNNELTPGLGDDYRQITIFLADGTEGSWMIQLSSQQDDGSYFYFYPSQHMFVDGNGDLYFAGSGGSYDATTTTWEGISVIKYAVGSSQPEIVVLDGGSDYSAFANCIFRNPQNGKLTLAGSFHLSETSKDYVLAEINDDGSLRFFAEYYYDDGFGNGWQANVSYTVMGADGDYYMVGYFYSNDGGISGDYSIFKYNPTTDKFSGLVPTSDILGDNETRVDATELAWDAQGNLIVRGNMTKQNYATSDYDEYAVFKYSPTGELLTEIVRIGDQYDQLTSTHGAGRLAVDEYSTIYALDIYGDGIVKIFAIEADVPSRPLNVAINQRTTTSLGVIWSTPAWHGNAPISGYKIAYRAEGTTTWQHATVDNSTFSYLITGLLSGTEYEIEVFALNSVGQSMASDDVAGWTLAREQIVPGAPNTGLR